MNSYLETAIAVVLIILIFSIVTYVIQELIAANLQYRGKMLESSIQQLLDGSKTVNTITSVFYNHPQISKLKEQADKLPSYVPAANFAIALIDHVAKNVPPSQLSGNLYNDFKLGIQSFVTANGDLKTLLKNYADTSKDLIELRTNIERWYNEYMDRVSGWYKKNTRTTIRIIAVVVTILFNVNMIEISTTINNNDNLKASLVKTADRLADQPAYIKGLYEKTIEDKITGVQDANKTALDAAIAQKDSVAILKVNKKVNDEKEEVLKNYTKNRIVEIDTLLKNIDNPELPIGWNENELKKVKEKWYMYILGWFIAAAAISMGAPFWFDMLLKLVNVRRAGKKPAAN